MAITHPDTGRRGMVPVGVGPGSDGHVTLFPRGGIRGNFPESPGRLRAPGMRLPAVFWETRARAAARVFQETKGTWHGGNAASPSLLED